MSSLFFSCSFSYSFFLSCILSERKARKLYYYDLRDRVLRSECDRRRKCISSCRYALQADHSDHPSDSRSQGHAVYFQPKEYFSTLGKSSLECRKYNYIQARGAYFVFYHSKIWFKLKSPVFVVFGRWYADVLTRVFN